MSLFPVFSSAVPLFLLEERIPGKIGKVALKGIPTGHWCSHEHDANRIESKLAPPRAPGRWALWAKGSPSTQEARRAEVWSIDDLRGWRAWGTGLAQFWGRRWELLHFWTAFSLKKNKLRGGRLEDFM